MLGNGLRFLPVLGLSLFCGGSLSNLHDRIALGKVVDFVKFGLVGLSPYIFNLADLAIGTGIIIIIFSSIWYCINSKHIYNNFNP
jgi:signal peptidase II